MVGAELLKRLRQAGVSVTGTTRRRERVGADIVHLDLSQEVQGWRPPGRIDVAILCAGVIGIQACEDQPLESRLVNVDAIASLARNLSQAGAFVIYLSSNQVFDGTAPFRTPADVCCPVTEYGRQKAEAEQRLLEEGSAGSILRLTKILGPTNPLFATWRKSLHQGQSIQPFSDLTFAPVPLSSVAGTVSLLAARRLGGIFHLSGERDITYEEAALMGARAIGADTNLVRPVKAPGNPPPAQTASAHATLDMNALKIATGLVPPDVQWTVETAFRNPALLV